MWWMWRIDVQVDMVAIPRSLYSGSGRCHTQQQQCGSIRAFVEVDIKEAHGSCSGRSGDWKQVIGCYYECETIPREVSLVSGYGEGKGGRK
ncbi:hypothetical protein GOP47_0012117 [Adiantum capillus-veneris]|uniref:Uncharacterized protein n=1 Tax=Adiantum capillus-veneris TaxID=13818 RepID=A0A9D4ZGK8_ADICA|nr:hypothetical protein GOP47_0012117 [Adiantum capillus-veneris]